MEIKLKSFTRNNPISLSEFAAITSIALDTYRHNDSSINIALNNYHALTENSSTFEINKVQFELWNASFSIVNRYIREENFKLTRELHYRRDILQQKILYVLHPSRVDWLDGLQRMANAEKARARTLSNLRPVTYRRELKTLERIQREFDKASIEHSSN